MPTGCTAVLAYDSIRATVDAADGEDDALERVEVNQRALIDKILARYASAGAVYRELLQNSNDAEATVAEIYFTTEAAANADGRSNGGGSGRSDTVSQVVYRNNGMPFRKQDWSRLKKIAEGNPDVAKVGAFGVGAYTMFSICEEPLVLSGSEALAFVWKGDALWTKRGPRKGPKSEWTSFVLPSRDPYPVPDMVEFGEFLCASLTFTKCLKLVRVLVDDVEHLSIIKTLVQEPRLVTTPKSEQQSSSWWSVQKAAHHTASPRGTFYLSKPDKSIMESIYRFTVQLDDETASIDARYVSCQASTKIGADMARRMQRVTKKDPPPSVNVDIFLNAQDVESTKPTTNKAERITLSFSPSAGAGRIFIGFRTSQTTGLAAHIAAPFIPTVEREAMDLQDATLRIFNTELLEFTGILMRLVLENTMYQVIDAEWRGNAVLRQREEEQLEKQLQEKKSNGNTTSNTEPVTNDSDEEEEDKSSGSFLSFARYMAKGVKKKIVSVVSTVEQMMDDGAELLNPPDPRPLSSEERQAVLLMRAFCPRQSTPDPLVGTCLAQGFGRCMPDTSPPVLTRSGVVRGDLARLSNQGMEAFVQQNTVRSIVYKNAEEYHTVIARVPKVNLQDLQGALSSKVLERDVLVRLIQWWTKYSRIDARGTSIVGSHLKDMIRFYAISSDDADSKQSKGKDANERLVSALKDMLFYVEKESLLSGKPQLPLPDSVIPVPLANEIGLSYLSDASMNQWFAPLPMEIWAEFISHNPSMNDAKPEDEKLRLEVLSILAREYNNRHPSEKMTWSGFCRTLLADRRCIPFDSLEPVPYAADKPADLYLYSAELKAFDGLGSKSSFRKASQQLKSSGVSEDFLLQLGVRKSVSIDFLFANLHTLQWSKDPKPLIEYLRSATLTGQDLQKLQNTKYLPAEKNNRSDKGAEAVSADATSYAPPELYLPCPDLRIFPFVRILHWPTEQEVSERSQNGKFLVKLGMNTLPPLQTVLSYATDGIPTEEKKARTQCLDFLCDRLGPHGPYHDEYHSFRPSQRQKFRMLPCVVKAPLKDSSSTKSELFSPVSCYSDPNCSVMGFPILDPALGDSGKLYGNLFQCNREPPADLLLHQLKHLVAVAKNNRIAGEEEASRVETIFAAMFVYLSHRSSDLGNLLGGLRNESFIPVATNGKLAWYSPQQVFFRREKASEDEDSLTEELFQVIDFSPFLAAAGVKQEATTKDLFQLMLQNPESVLKILGSEKKYRALLRRIAANPPFTRVTPTIRASPFLLAYKLTNNPDEKQAADEKATYYLAKAEDTFVIDNSFFGRMFLVPRAPHESDLEDFYVRLGSSYISKSVERRFEIVGSPKTNTSLTRALQERVQERSPLLVSPNITSRPLVRDAKAILSEKKLNFHQASNLMAVYSLNGITRRNRTTCFSRKVGGRNQHAIYVVEEFDWFDVGYAIGDLVLERCQLEDAFFISSLLEAPLEQLRARGFPVDRILKPEPPPEPPKPPPAPRPAIAPGAVAVDADGRSAPSSAPIADGTATADPTRAPPKTGGANPHESSNGAKPSPPPTAPPPPPVPAVVKDTKTPAQEKGPTAPSGGFVDILKQMFPDADEQYLRGALGKDPKLEDLQSLAEQMSSGNYPRSDTASDAGTVDTAASSRFGSEQEDTTPKKNKRGLRKKLGKAFSGLRPSSFGGAMPPPPMAPSQMGAAGAGPGPGPGPPAGVGGMGGGVGVSSSVHHESRNPVSPASDAQTQDSLEQMLRNAVDASASVNQHGIQSQDRQVTSSIPEGLDRGDTCEVVSGQSLKPYPGPNGTGRTSNGILVFSWSKDSSSEAFLNDNQDCLENFSLVIARLCEVYDLQLPSLAIYHNPTGGTIAFNSGRALHMNIRFFHALFYLQGKPHSRDCYSYWYVVFAHELAHHLVSAHNKEHGFYTESYTAQYLPKLVSLLKDL